MDDNNNFSKNLDLSDSEYSGGTGSGPYMREYEHMQAMAAQERREKERRKRLTPEQIKKEEEEKRLKLKQEKEKREK